MSHSRRASIGIGQRLTKLVILLSSIQGCGPFCEQPTYPVNKTIVKEWEVPAGVEVSVDFSGGWFDVETSREGRVKAVLDIHAVTRTSYKNTQKLVDDGVNLLGHQNGIKLDISATQKIYGSLILHVIVPNGSHIKIHSGWGQIRAGYDPTSGDPVSFSPKAFIARTDRLGGISLNVQRPVYSDCELKLESEALDLVVDNVPIDIGSTGADGKYHYYELSKIEKSPAFAR